LAATEEISFRSSDIELTVLPGYGARLHRLRVFGHDLLRTPADPREHERDPFFWGAFVMAPWCNRLTTGPMEIGGRVVDLRSSFADGTAIHGHVYATPWQADARGHFRTEGGDDGWPWRYATSLDVAVDDHAVRLEQTLTNLSDGPMPGGLGIHPWFVGHVRIAIHADLVYPSNHPSDPEPRAVEGELDLRRPTEMAVGVDATWPQVSDPAVDLWWPEAGLHCVMRVLSVTPHVVAANPGNRAAIAVEPETHAPQGLRRLVDGSPGALTLLAPGEDLRLTSVLEFERSA
jgi:aldose 1-epimerase